MPEQSPISDQQLRIMLENAKDSFFIHDDQGQFLDANKSACKELGYSLDELLALKVFDIESGLDATLLIDEIWPSMNHGDSIQTSGEHTRKNGSIYPVDVTITCIVENKQRLFLALVRNTTDTEKLKEHLKKLAMTDELTGLYNRRAFMNILEKEIASSSRRKSSLILMSLDLDYFKKINDMFGHCCGDIALMEFAKIASDLIRSGDFLGRIGGEEFAIILTDSTMRYADKMAERLRESIAQNQVKHNGFCFSYSLSIGICCNPIHNKSADVLINNADLALYKAKSAGRNCVMVYNADCL